MISASRCGVTRSDEIFQFIDEYSPSEQERIVPQLYKIYERLEALGHTIPHHNLRGDIHAKTRMWKPPLECFRGPSICQLIAILSDFQTPSEQPSG